jgi:hypothetical protein
MSSFIERFSIVGMAGVLGLMLVVGIYGFASLLGVEPDEPLRSLAPREVEEAPGLDGPARPVEGETVRSEASPAPEPGETPPASPTPRPGDESPSELPAAVLDEVRPGGGFGGPAAAPPADTPGPAPIATAVANTPAPAPNPPPPSTPGPPTPAPAPPTPPPAGCSVGGDPRLDRHGRDLSFSFGAVVSFEAGQPGVLVVDVGGTVVSLLITEGTEVRGQLGAATLVSGQGWRANDATIIAISVEVLCPDWAR